MTSEAAKPTPKNRVRIATLQYYIRPIKDFDAFREQVRGLVVTAGDYGCQMVVFPEYFCLQLLTLGDLNLPMPAQVRRMARMAPDVLSLMKSLAQEVGIYVVAGTVPVLDKKEKDKLYNECHVFGPGGQVAVQGKLHMTRFEKEEWFVSPSSRLTLMDTEFGRMAVAICYDVEFPEVTRAAARQGATILVCPSCTDDRQGFLRVRYCAQARAIENQLFVVHSSTVGSLPMVPAVSMNYGQASILTPSDFPFARDGILAEGIPNQEQMVIGELNLEVLEANRFRGTVLPLRDSERSADLVARTELVSLPGVAPAPATPSAPAPRRKIVVRQTREEDFAGIRDVGKLVYPDMEPWGDAQLRSHLAIFPEGQFVAIEEHSGLVVGMCSSLIIAWDHYEPTQSWVSMTNGGMYTNHDPVRGRTLYAADVMVRPGSQGRGVGKLLYERGRIGTAQHLGLKRILAGARLQGYAKHRHAMSPTDYALAVVEGKLKDPTLTFQINRGFQVVGVIENYFRGDPKSMGHAALIQWLNPDAASAKDALVGDKRFRAAHARGDSARGRAPKKRTPSTRR